MAVLNYAGDEINAKIVYYGPGVSGKTTNLDHMHKHMPVESKGKMMSMKTRTDRTLFFDFLPVDFGDVGGYRTRVLVYTVPGQVYYNATRKLVLKGADAIVFVADSAPEKLAENVESLRNLEENLNELGLSLDNVPWVIQYNKRDLPNALTIQQMEEQLNLLGVPAFEATANNGAGVFETFGGIAEKLHGYLVTLLSRGEITGQEGEAAPGETAPPPEPLDSFGDAIDSALREVDGKATTTAQPPTPKPAPEAPAADNAVYEIADESPSDYEATIAAMSGDEASQRAQSVGSPVEQASPAQPTASAQQPPTPPAQPAPAAEPAPPTPEAIPAPPQADAIPDASLIESIGEGEIEEDVGRTVSFEEAEDASDAVRNDDPGEFITDPMGQRTIEVEPETPPELEPSEEREHLALTVPVVISRSQVRKSLPIKLLLEIQVVDD